MKLTKLEIHWPDGQVVVIDTKYGSHEEDSILLEEIIKLSYTYDVIIDNGKVTFVDKE